MFDIVLADLVLWPLGMMYIVVILDRYTLSLVIIVDIAMIFQYMSSVWTAPYAWQHYTTTAYLTRTHSQGNELQSTPASSFQGA